MRWMGRDHQGQGPRPRLPRSDQGPDGDGDGVDGGAIRVGVGEQPPRETQGPKDAAGSHEGALMTSRAIQGEGAVKRKEEEE